MFTEGYQKCGQVFSVPMFTKPMVMLVGPEVLGHFFKATDEQMSQQEVYQFNVPTFGRGVVFDVDHTIRREQFRWFAEALKPNRLRMYVDQMIAEAEDYFGKWGDEGEVDLLQELASLLILTASRCLLGKEVREQMFNEVAGLFHDLDMGMQPISVMFPYLPIEAHRKRDAARTTMGEIFKKVIAQRRASGEKQVDILQAFIDAKYSQAYGGRVSNDEEITGMLIAGLFAGQHTSQVTSTWTALYLHRGENRDTFLRNVMEEQKELMREHGDTLNFDVLNQMNNLHWSMKEVLRMHPPLVMLMRYARQPFKVKTRKGEEYTVPKGAIVGTSPTMNHTLDYVYKKPEKFDPLRFGPGREEDKFAPFAFNGFGGGRHSCMGEHFGYMQVKALLSVLVRNFDIELVGDFPVPDFDSMVVGPKGKCMARFRRRKLDPQAPAGRTE